MPAVQNIKAAIGENDSFAFIAAAFKPCSKHISVKDFIANFVKIIHAFRNIFAKIKKIIRKYYFCFKFCINFAPNLIKKQLKNSIYYEKIVNIPVLFTSIAVLSSCTEDGVKPNPTPANSIKKISEIYYEFEQHRYVSNDNGQTWITIDSSYIEKEIRERWTWDGDKLSSIDNYSELYDNHSYIFTYNEDGLVAEVIDPIEKEKMVCFYENDQISKLEFHYGDKSVDVWYLVYSDNKIIRINTIHSLCYITFTWNDNNVSMIKYFEDECVAEQSYTYDNKQNPYRGSNALLALSLAKNDFALMSANNITSDTLKYFDYPIFWPEKYYKHKTYTYLYNNNYPTRKTNPEEHIVPLTEPDCFSKSIEEKRYYFNYLDN